MKYVEYIDAQAVTVSAANALTPAQVERGF
jgi:hypothetical protein